MVFSRFFKSGDAPEPAERADSDDGDSSDEGFEGAEELPDEEAEPSWGERAAAIIPMGSSTGSKRPESLWGAPDAHAPTHYWNASGCRVQTPDELTLIDCSMALGSVALGYADERVTSAVVAAASTGTVSGLPSILEVEVAERFAELVPCAERAQFLKSGAEAVAAAVRIARTYTGRSKVVGCGYFGWLDWCSDASGIPGGVRSDYAKVPFDDVSALETAVSAAGSDLAAVVIEPVIERMPSPEWIQRARALTAQAGAALIFDEIKTGFRLSKGGFQELSGVTPDLAAFGKALANGYPLAAVCGSAALMSAAQKTWISSTLAGETVGLAAARAVIRLHETEDVCAALAATGAAMRLAVGNAIRASGTTGISVHGIDQMWFLKFDTPELEARFLVAAVACGVLFKRGPYNFAALAHDEETILEIEAATSTALVTMRDADA
jgi:glutamate-1-semialdehyde aminotransferase